MSVALAKALLAQGTNNNQQRRQVKQVEGQGEKSKGAEDGLKMNETSRTETGETEL